MPDGCADGNDDDDGDGDATLTMDAGHLLVTYTNTTWVLLTLTWGTLHVLGYDPTVTMPRLFTAAFILVLSFAAQLTLANPSTDPNATTENPP